MAKSRQQFTGKHLNSVVIAPLKQAAYVSGDGTALADNGGPAAASLAATLVDGVAFAGTVEEVEFDQEYETEDATMLGQEHGGEVLGVHRVSCTMTEVLQYRNGCLLSSAYNNAVVHADGDDSVAKIAQVTIKRAGSVFSFVGNMRSYRETYRGKGKTVGVMVITGIDPVAAMFTGGAWNAQPSIGTYGRTNGI